MVNSVDAADWPVVALGDCVDVLDRFRKPVNAKERAARPGPVPYYGATGQVGWIDVPIFEEELVLLGEDGAPFLDKSKPIAYIIDGPSWVNNHAHVLRAKQDMTSNRYIKHYLDSFDFTDFVQGSTRDKLNQGTMKAIPVPMPPLEIQEQLVAAIEGVTAARVSAEDHLSSATRAIERFRQAVLVAGCSGRLSQDWDLADDDQLEQLLVEADVVRKARLGKKFRDFSEVLDDLPDLPSHWRWVALGRITAQGPQNGLYLPQDRYGDGTPIVRIENYQLFGSDGSSEFKRVTATTEERERYALSAGDILINRVNSPSHLGKALVVEERHLPALFESNLMRMRVDGALALPKYIGMFLRSLRGRQLLTANAKWAVNQASINQGDVISTPVPLPPIEEQREIVRRVDTLFEGAEGLIHRIEGADRPVQRSWQAVLAKAFRGDLVGSGTTER